MKKTLENTWAILDKPERKRFVSLVILDIITSIADILSLALLLWIIKFYIDPNPGNDIPYLPHWLTDKNSVWLIALFFLAFALKNMIAWIISNTWYKFIARVAVRLSRLHLFNYQHSGFGEFVNVDSSIHIRRIAFQPFEFSQYILSGIPQIISQASLIFLTIIAIVLFNAKLFLLLLILLVPPVIVVFFIIRSRLSKARNLIKTGNETSFQHLLDALKGYVESNIYGRNDFFLQRFTKSREKFSKSVFESIGIQAMPPRMIEIFAVLGLFILIAVAKWTGNNDTDYLITIGAFVGATYKIIPGIVKIINISGQIKAYEFSVPDILRNQPTTTTAGESKAGGRIQSLELKNIHFNYDDQSILHNFSLSARQGDFLVITGESGKGKTTILNILLGFLEPKQGTILINDRETDSQGIQQYWPTVSYVKQQSFLIHDTILRNITLEEDGHDRKKLDHVVSASGISGFIDEATGGLDKMITENGKNISGGQRQRIAIARALYKDASLIILDEPFNELDEGSELALITHFRKLTESGAIVILITHNKKSLAQGTKTISLDA